MLVIDIRRAGRDKNNSNDESCPSIQIDLRALIYKGHANPRANPHQGERRMRRRAIPAPRRLPRLDEEVRQKI